MEPKEEKNISNLLRKASEELKLQLERLNKRSFRVEVGQPDRITSAVHPYFEHISDQEIMVVEAKYPNTIKALFELALRLKQGKYGQKLLEAFGFSQDSISSYHLFIFLLLFDLSQRPQTTTQTEIMAKIKKSPNFLKLFSHLKEMAVESVENVMSKDYADLTRDERWPLDEISKILSLTNISKLELKALLHLFHSYVANLENPSHLLVDCFLQVDQVKEAIECAKGLTHRHEQSKSFLDIVLYLLKQSRYQEAVQLTFLIQNEGEKNKAVDYVVEALLEENHVEEAVGFSKSLSEPSVVDHSLGEIAVRLTTKDKLNQALLIVRSIKDLEAKAYTLSRLVNILTSKESFQQAKEIAFSIEEEGFREDAIEYILKKLLALHRAEEATKFIENIKNPKEKAHAIKIVESVQAAASHSGNVEKMLAP